jgi:hypothetical protein
MVQDCLAGHEFDDTAIRTCIKHRIPCIWIVSGGSLAVCSLPTNGRRTLCDFAETYAMPELAVC